MAKRLSPLYFSTQNEIDFLDDLSTRENARLLLQNYVESSKLRQDWGNINRVVAITHAKGLIKAEAL